MTPTPLDTEDRDPILARKLASDTAPVPPRGLSATALSAVAHVAVVEGHFDSAAGVVLVPGLQPIVTPRRPQQRPPKSDPLFEVGRRADLIVAVCLGFLAVGLVLAGLQKLRHTHDVKVCQNQLRTLHGAAEEYASNHHGRYPQVGNVEAPQAGQFANILNAAGVLPMGFFPICPNSETRLVPTTAKTPLPVGYTYTLGYQAPNGTLQGLRRPDSNLDSSDLQVLAADFPTYDVAPGVGPFSGHSTGMNVLYTGGQVSYVKRSGVGIDGDDVYHNAAGRIAAGLNVKDSCLGRPDDKP